MAMNQTVSTRERAHPTPARYTAIALILGVITVVEVAIVYMEFFRPVLIPILLVLSAIKFAMVCMFFMHLRFDNRLFSVLFVGGLLLASAVIISLMALFSVSSA